MSCLVVFCLQTLFIVPRQRGTSLQLTRQAFLVVKNLRLRQPTSQTIRHADTEATLLPHQSGAPVQCCVQCPAAGQAVTQFIHESNST